MGCRKVVKVIKPDDVNQMELPIELIKPNVTDFKSIGKILDNI